MSAYNFQTLAEDVALDCQAVIANKTVLVTGVSPGGLGAEFAKVIALHRPSLIILANRDPLKAQQTAKEILVIAPDVPTRLLKLDLASQTQVRNAAQEVLAYDEHIDVLVNNAGVMASPFSLSEDSVESQFATNHVGHFLFTNLIMSKLVRSGKSSRVVNVSSNGHQLGPVRFHDWNFDDGKNYDAWLAYGQTKSANMLFSVSLAQKLGSKGLTAVSLHPGTIQTHLGGGRWDELYESLIKWFTLLGYFRGGQNEILWKTLSQGVATHVFAAFHPSLTASENNGSYVQDCTVSKPEHVRSWARDPIEAEQLWKLTEEIMGEKFEY
ncbi:short-chain dehydrogenase [Aspergillus sclerotioniger CBS 115572]|uniref:Short-chain dehydrogenase n=1 Tax=Aspergillus sclerotioniger CBS 115572 TaxID=1450535 RepID=A0A317VUL3_9EURO|nr:short-chain dehydrogenase [Aspergillus sclerotioniger CBS 115572]PWY77289.1 short-chain dehydrogenase [Aspergillus sclerotioniger CBS 115572]